MSDNIKYISIAQFCEKLKANGGSIHRSNVLRKLHEGRIPGAYKVGSTWIIPDNAEYPKDSRFKSGKYVGVYKKYNKSKKEKMEE